MTVLACLQAVGFHVNLCKSLFAQPELDYLGYQLTCNGIHPQPKKVEAILCLEAPTNKLQLRHFLGMVNYYRDMWQKWSHILAPLMTLLSKEVMYVWGPEQQKVFEEIKNVVSQEVLLTFPDFNKPFHIYTDASTPAQLGAVAIQDAKPLAFYSQKLSKTQSCYMTGEKELLSVVETLKEFQNILLGQQVIIHTDHKNIIYGNLSNDRIAQWRLLLEEYGPEYVHIAGKNNIVADALSQLQREDVTEPIPDEVGQMTAYVLKEQGQIESSLFDKESNYEN